MAEHARLAGHDKQVPPTSRDRTFQIAGNSSVTPLLVFHRMATTLRCAFQRVVLCRLLTVLDTSFMKLTRGSPSLSLIVAQTLPMST